jgi:uncharacterized membrane protein
MPAAAASAAMSHNCGGFLMNKRFVIASALAAAVAAPAYFTAADAAPAPAPAFKAEKCYGIAKAGKNDCASTGNNSCAGTSKANADPKAWVFVPEGYCDRIVNASKAAK